MAPKRDHGETMTQYLAGLAKTIIPVLVMQNNPRAVLQVRYTQNASSGDMGQMVCIL